MPAAARVRTLFATNSVLGKFGVGGPGIHLLRALLRELGPVAAFARGYEGPPLPGGTLRILEPPAWARAIRGTRLGRLAVRSQAKQRIEFDRWAARGAPECDLAIVENSTSLGTIGRVRKGGARVLLKFNNHPFALMGAAVEEERRRWGGPRFFVDAEQVERTRAEAAAADLVFAMSDSVLDALETDGVPRAKLRRARYGVDAERFRPAARPAEGFVVAFVGWLDLRKGYPYLVEAFRDAAIPGSRLLLHGGSNDRFHHELVARLAGGAAVEVVRGPVEETYARAAVTVLPSVSDAFGNAVPESMACGVPPIVTDLCGAAEVVRDGVDGFVVPARDPGAIRERLLRLHGDPALRARMGAAAREAALAMPWSRFEEDALRIARECLATPRA